VTQEEWEQQVPAGLRGDALWKRQDFRLSSYVADTAWADVDALVAHAGTREVAAQLYRSLGSISANIAEGYSRGASGDRVRFFEYALGSAREAREWYRRAQPILGVARVTPRGDLLTSIVRLLLVVIPAERALKTNRFASSPRRHADG
jgi:four helix bundle protein